MPQPQVEQLYETRAIQYPSESSQPETFGYRLLHPPAVEPGQTYPLVLYLHGSGERGLDNRIQLRFLPTWMTQSEHRERHACYLLAPQCRPDAYWVETPRTRDQQRPPAGTQLQVVINILDAVMASFPVDPRRVYLTGLSMGGYAAWDLGTRLAQRWAAVAPICGGGDEAFADRLVDVPVWAWHGDADRIVPVEASRRMVEALRQAGGNPRYTELPGVGHDSWTPAYTAADGLIPWMFAQQKGAPQSG